MTDSSDKKYLNTTLKPDLLRSLRILAAQHGKRLNMLLEEAISDLLKKYEKKAK